MADTFPILLPLSTTKTASFYLPGINLQAMNVYVRLSASLANMQTMYALQSQVLHTQQERISALGKQTTVAGRVAPLPVTYELPPYNGTISAHRCSSVHAQQSIPVVPRISPLMVLAESAAMESREGIHGKREASQALYGEDKRQRYA